MKDDTLDKAAKSVKDTIDNATDKAHEVTHRAQAGAERDKREAAGDEMTASQKAGSVTEEVKHRTQAEIDAAKQHLRK